MSLRGTQKLPSQTLRQLHETQRTPKSLIVWICPLLKSPILIPFAEEVVLVDSALVEVMMTALVLAGHSPKTAWSKAQTTTPAYLD